MRLINLTRSQHIYQLWVMQAWNIRDGRRFEQRKQKFWLTVNPGVALGGFQTTGPVSYVFGHSSIIGRLNSVDVSATILPAAYYV